MDWILRNDLPIYTQLIRHITDAIVSGEMRAGSKLPSVRDLALEAGVNPNTVQRALTDLEREGLVFSKRTAGRFVTEDCELIQEKRLRMAEEIAEDFLKAMNKIGLNKEEIIDLIKNFESKSKGGINI